MPEINKVGEHIALLRKNMNITQESLAEKLGISAQAISKWENGHSLPEATILPQLSNLLHCTIDNILLPKSGVNTINKPIYVHMLLPYKDVDPYTGSWWPRSIAFPAVMTALKLFMGLEERCNYNDHQINDDQEYILQSGISLQAFGFSYYFKEQIHDCFNIYGCDYETVNCDGKEFSEISEIITSQIHLGYPVIIQNREYNANYLFITGYIADGKILKAHEFMEGFDEKNCNMNPYEMETIDNWLKPDMELILIRSIDKKLSIGQACKNALYRYCLLMDGMLENEIFVGRKTDKFFQNFMGYGEKIFNNWIDHLKREEKEAVDSLNSFSPQECILHESNFRTAGFLHMCKQYIEGINVQCLNSAIDRYRILCEHSHEILNIMAERTLENKSISEKRITIINYLVRSKEIHYDAINDIKEAIDYYNSEQHK